MISNIKRTLIGLPLHSNEASHERLSNFQALAILSSDALSSVAYATEEILLVLVVAPLMLDLSWPISIAISVLLFVVSISYYQTIHAYPTGGGAYRVCSENLGTVPSLVAGASLLTDYILTVAVSISAGVAAIVSAFPELLPWRVPMALLAILIVTIINLRGVKESGRVFALPTYFFICMMYLLIIVGLIDWFMVGDIPRPVTHLPETVDELTRLGMFILVLRAFASGCTAMTGVEAISDGVSIFKSPEAHNAGKTLLGMAALLVSMFLGITFLANHLGLVPGGHETIVSQLARIVFGTGVLYYTTQAATALILFLAANTSYSDFPRLAMWMAKDSFLPRQLTNVGDRLVYNNGIVALGVFAAGLVVFYQADTHGLVPLYAVGVFISFTLNQAGMVRRWFKLKTPNWKLSATINGLGAITTGIVLVVIASSKFTHGAWIILLLIPAQVMAFRAIYKHYMELNNQLSLDKDWPPEVTRHTVIIPVAGIHRGIVKAVNYGKMLNGDLYAITVDIVPEQTDALCKKWTEIFPDVRLMVLPSPYRSVVDPLVDFMDEYVKEEGDYVTVLVPEFVPAKWWHHLLHNQMARILRWRMLYARRNWPGRYRIISEVPFYLAR